MKKITLLLFAIYALTFFTRCGNDDEGAPVPFTVSGIVKSDEGAALQGVLVNSIVDTTLTDANGAYTLVSHPFGAIEYTKEGFSKHIEAVDERTSIDVNLLKIPDGSETEYDVRFDTVQCVTGDLQVVTFVEVKDFGLGTGTTTWSRDKVWVLKNKVFVNEGQTLTIEPGTIIKGGSGQAESSTALIVTRGGKIVASGTRNLPIIFTSESDPIIRGTDNNICVNTNLTKNDKGLWGGVVVLGKAILNNNDEGGEATIEGIADTELRGVFGGNIDDDNSGVLRYVSIRHGGTKITVDKEINALLLGGVGSATTVEYVEAFACKDDGFEIYGGKVNTRYLVSAFNGDDAFDYNQGWRGENQFWFGYLTIEGERTGEHDGGTAPTNGTPFSTPIIYNATFIGPGTDSGKRAATFRKNAGGEYHNSIMMNFAFGVDIEFTGADQQDCFRNLQDDGLIFKNNILDKIGNSPVFVLENKSSVPNNDPSVQFAVGFLTDYFLNNGNTYTNPDLNSQFIPLPDGPAVSAGSVPSSSFFKTANYKGCFEPDEIRWIDDWTRTAEEL